MGLTDPDGDVYEDISRQRPGYGADERGYGGESHRRDRSQPYSSASDQGRYGPQAPRFTSQNYTGQNYTGQDYPVRGYVGETYGARAGYAHDEAPRERREAWENDVHRGDVERRRGAWDDRREHGREGGGDFLHRAGERISSWFRGDDLMRGSREHEHEDAHRRFGRESHAAVHGHRGVGPKGYQRSDERISDEVHDRLTEDSWLDATDIQVEVKGGEVTLSGHVDNREAKHRAERLIEDLSGVRHVQNNLRVNPNAGLTTAGSGFGSSALEAEMRRNAGDGGGGDLSGRTGAGAERSTEAGKRN